MHSLSLSLYPAVYSTLNTQQCACVCMCTRHLLTLYCNTVLLLLFRHKWTQGTPCARLAPCTRGNTLYNVSDDFTQGVCTLYRESTLRQVPPTSACAVSTAACNNLYDTTSYYIKHSTAAAATLLWCLRFEAAAAFRTQTSALQGSWRSAP